MVDIAFALSPSEIAFAGTAVEHTRDAEGFIESRRFEVVDGIADCPDGSCGPTYTPRATPTATVIPTPGLCVADCDRNDSVQIFELIRAVNISLGNVGIFDCPPADSNSDTMVGISELVQAVLAAAVGCRGQVPTP